MKALLSICLIAASTIAQRAPLDKCSDKVRVEYDKVTGTTSIVGIRQLVVSDIRKKGFSIQTVMTPSGVIIVSFTILPTSPGCVDDHAPIYILFRDGSRMQTNSGNSVFNCDGDVPIYFGGSFGKESQMLDLLAKPIETVRILTLKSFVQQDFSSVQSNELMSQLNCLHSYQQTNSQDSSDVTRQKQSKTISGGVLNGRATSLSRPEYPAEARAVRASGSVIVAVLIDETGKVISAVAQGGNPLLRAAAEDAAKKAVFPETILGGQAVKVSGIIVYNFVP